MKQSQTITDIKPMKYKLIAQINTFIILKQDNKLVIDLASLTQNFLITFGDIFTLNEKDLATLIVASELSNRNKSSFQKLNLVTIADLAQTKIADLFRQRGIGKISFQEIFHYFAKYETKGELEISFADQAKVLSLAQQIIKTSNNDYLTIRLNTLWSGKDLFLNELITVPPQQLDLGIETLALSDSITTLLLERMETTTIKELIEYPLGSLIQQKGFGKKTIQKIIDKLVHLSSHNSPIVIK